MGCYFDGANNSFLPVSVESKPSESSAQGLTKDPDHPKEKNLESKN
jgi:hypothetical protein